jgi:hypothetical protein
MLRLTPAPTGAGALVLDLAVASTLVEAVGRIEYGGSGSVCESGMSRSENAWISSSLFVLATTHLRCSYKKMGRFASDSGLVSVQVRRNVDCGVYVDRKRQSGECEESRVFDRGNKVNGSE